MGKKRSHTSPSDTAYKAEARDKKNKDTKIARHQKVHSNDLQKIGEVPSYNRKKPMPYSFGTNK